MWDVENETPFAHAHSWDRGRDGADTWIVVVKGTFDILGDGSTRVAPEQAPVCELPAYHGRPGRSSLRLDTDLVRTKPTTDLIVLGHACAPRDRAVARLDVSLLAPGISKTLRVHGDRLWRRGVGGVIPGLAQPFERMPIVYERAWGGGDPVDLEGGQWDERNPVGLGHATERTPLVDRPVPNVERLGGDGPGGFGAIAPHWVQRRRFAGTYGIPWERERKPLWPSDLDDRFYLCSPDDQRPARHFTGGEPIQVHHMTPDGALRFRLPRVLLGFETHFRSGAPVLHRQTLHSVIIEPDQRRCALVWQTALPCHHQVLKLEHTVVTEKRLLRANGGRDDDAAPGRSDARDGSG